MKHFISLFLICHLTHLKGQAKNCWAKPERKVPVTCTLSATRTISDTIVTFLTKDCDLWHFPSDANGTWKIYRSDSSTVAGTIQFSNGQYHGSVVLYHLNGKLSEIASYTLGTLSGPYKILYDDGKTDMDGEMTSNQFTGSIYKYWDNGKLACKEFVVKDSWLPIRKQYWNPDGQQIDEITFKNIWDCK